MDLFDFVHRLIDIPSVTEQEWDVALFLHEYFQQRGVPVAFQDVAPRRVNIVVDYSERTRLILCSHLDTVSPHFPARRDGGYIYGRGACDAKGIIGSMVFAFNALRDRGVKDCALLFVVGEEKDSIGARAAAQKLRCSFIVVGEPTENKLARGQKGSLSYMLTCRGVAGHSAYPERGRSAIHELLELLRDIQDADWGLDTLLGGSTLNIGTVSGGTGANVIAEDAKAALFHRLVDGCAQRKKQLLEIVGDRADVNFHAESDPQTLRVIDGFDTTVVNFGSDVQYLREIGEPLLIGPGSIHDAHHANEKISMDQLRAAIEIYISLYTALM